jgi:ABC-type uncharacterized transport system permease subunit
VEQNIFVEIILSSLRLSVPLVFAAMGGILSERAGIANIALESYLLFSAFAAAAVTAITQNIALGVTAGLLASAMVGASFAFVCIKGRGDQIVVGTAFNLFALGLIPLLSKSIFGMSGSTPALPASSRISSYWIFVVIAIACVFLVHVVFKYSRHGLRIHSAGENPLALETQGVPSAKVQYRAVIEGSLIAGLGGIYLVLVQASGFTRNMSAGRGFIALAAIIFGAWKPIPTLLACFFFGLTDAVQMQMQGMKVGSTIIPNQFIQILPYVIALIIVSFFSRSIIPPKAINSLSQKI